MMTTRAYMTEKGRRYMRVPRRPEGKPLHHVSLRRLSVLLGEQLTKEMTVASSAPKVRDSSPEAIVAVPP